MISTDKRMQDMSPKLEATINPDESIIWRGKVESDHVLRPVQNLYLIMGVVLLLSLILNLVWIDFEFEINGSITWTIGAIVFVFLVIVVDRRRSRSKTQHQLSSIVYLLTEKRAICAIGDKSDSISTFPLETLCIIEKRLSTNGIGDLIFSKEVAIDSDNCPYTKELGFIGIRDVKAVEELILKFQTSLRKT